MTFAIGADRRTKRESSGSVEPGVVRRRFDSGLPSAFTPSLGNQQTQALLGRSSPSNLAISQPDDPSEQEAERIATEIVHPNTSSSCSRGEPCHCDHCLQRRASETGTISGDVTPSINSLGRPLDDTTREFFEPRFGRDFSNVRVHTGPDASRSARALGAHAYTIGQDIVFGEGRYAPETRSGKHLLAHELVHTVQQGSPTRIQRSTINSTLEFLAMVISGLDIGLVASIVRRFAIDEAKAYAPAGDDYGPQNALRHCIFAGLLDTWCWRVAMAEITGGALLLFTGDVAMAAGIAAYGAFMGLRIWMFLMSHEVFGDDGCGNHGTGTIDSKCDRHNNAIGLSIGGPFTSYATIISESKAALDGGKLLMTPGPKSLSTVIPTSGWRATDWMVGGPQQKDCSYVYIK